jgi:AGZA family xanthine/uracil permease-like MFS transporter
MTPGDLGSWSQLFFDNLSTLLGAVFALQTLTLNGVSQDVMNDYIWGRIVPGVGVTLFIGNIYYSWMAIRLTNKWGRQYTAQPYGLNTPQAFAFVFNVIFSVFFSNIDELGPDNAFILGYNVALGSNFISGCISVFLGCFGQKILKTVPPAALLVRFVEMKSDMMCTTTHLFYFVIQVPIAGIGFAFLGIEQLSYSVAAPIVGYNAIIWVYLGWYSGVKVGWGKFRIPEASMVILVGSVLGWITGLNTGQNVKDASKLVKWWGPVWTAGEMFSNFSLVVDYLGIVIPIGISAAATTLVSGTSNQSKDVHRSPFSLSTPFANIVDVFGQRQECWRSLSCHRDHGYRRYWHMSCVLLWKSLRYRHLHWTSGLQTRRRKGRILSCQRLSLLVSLNSP